MYFQKCVILGILIVLFNNSALAAGSVTAEIIAGETKFYSQTSNGEITNCAISFHGVDANGNFHDGSFGLIILGEGVVGSLFKLVAKKLNLVEGTVKNLPIQNACIEDKKGHTTINFKKVDSDESSFLSLGSASTLADIAISMHEAHKVSISYLLKGNMIDSIYYVQPIQINDLGRFSKCASELLSAGK